MQIVLFSKNQDFTSEEAEQLSNMGWKVSLRKAEFQHKEPAEALKCFESAMGEPASNKRYVWKIGDHYISDNDVELFIAGGYDL